MDLLSKVIRIVTKYVLVAVSELLTLTKQINRILIILAHILLVVDGSVQPATSLPSLPLEGRQTFAELSSSADM